MEPLCRRTIATMLSLLVCLSAWAGGMPGVSGELKVRGPPRPAGLAKLPGVVPAPPLEGSAPWEGSGCEDRGGEDWLIFDAPAGRVLGAGRTGRSAEGSRREPFLRS